MDWISWKSTGSAAEFLGNLFRAGEIDKRELNHKEHKEHKETADV